MTTGTARPPPSPGPWTAIRGASSTSSLTSTLAGVFVGGNLVACTADIRRQGWVGHRLCIHDHHEYPDRLDAFLAPSTVYTNDTLTANVTTSDAEGDTLTVTYDWYVDGSSVQDGLTTR